MFTLFDCLRFMGALLGLGLGTRLGWECLGPVGAGLGAVVGCVIGSIVGQVPAKFIGWVIDRELGRLPTDALRAAVRDCSWPPNTVLIELLRRGEDVDPELPIVLDLLADEDYFRRGFGWGALSSVWPELVARIPGYRVYATPEHCRQQVAALRSAIAESAQR